MEIADAIEHTKNKMGMKVSMCGMASQITHHRGAVNNASKFMLDEFQKHFYQAREAWLNGDLETVAEFFGLYV